MNCSQPTLSYHMKLLVDSTIIDAEKRGLWMHYEVNYAVLEEFQNYFKVEKKAEK